MNPFSCYKYETNVTRKNKNKYVICVIHSLNSVNANEMYFNKA